MSPPETSEARAGAPKAEAMALVIDRATLAAAEATAPEGAAILPDFLAIPRPDAAADGPGWAVWRDGARCVVRVSDGTGFAVATEMLALVWRRGGQPPLTSLGAALPSGLPATDLSQTPPPPASADLAFSFSNRARGEAAQALRRRSVVAGTEPDRAGRTAGRRNRAGAGSSRRRHPGRSGTDPRTARSERRPARARRPAAAFVGGVRDLERGG